MSPATCLRSLLQWESRMPEARADVVPFLQVRPWHHLQPNLLAGDSWFLELFHLPRRPRPYVVTTFQPFCRPLKVQKAPQRRLLNLMDSFRRLSSRPHCWWWLLLRAVMASLMEAICLSLIRNASQSPQAPQPKHKFTKTKNSCKHIDNNGK